MSAKVKKHIKGLCPKCGKVGIHDVFISISGLYRCKKCGSTHYDDEIKHVSDKVHLTGKELFADG